MSITPYGFVTPLVTYPEQQTPPSVPLQGFSVVPEEYAILRGRPRVPEAVWINAEGLVSTTGEYYTDRLSLLDVNEDSYVTFLPLDSDWDATAAVWTPNRDNSVARYTMWADIAGAPFLGSVDYTIGREAFSSDALVVSPGGPLHTDFNSGYDDSTQLTIALAMNVREITEDNLLTFGDTGWLRLTSTHVLANIGGHNFKVSIPLGPLNITPLYVVLKAAQPKATLTAGSSTSRIRQGSTSYGERTTDLAFDIGGAIDLFSVDIWGDASPSAVQIMSNYSAALGAM